MNEYPEIEFNWLWFTPTLANGFKGLTIIWQSYESSRNLETRENHVARVFSMSRSSRVEPLNTKWTDLHCQLFTRQSIHVSLVSMEIYLVMYPLKSWLSLSEWVCFGWYLSILTSLHSSRTTECLSSLTVICKTRFHMIGRRWKQLFQRQWGEWERQRDWNEIWSSGSRDRF
jgi:hypothetical protein